MDATRFDRLTRSLTAAHSRRHAVVSLLGGTFGLLSLSDVDARKRKKKGKNGNGKRKNKEDTCPAERVCADSCCEAGETCQNGTTCCPPERVCAEGCCAAGQVCQNGTTCCTEDVAAFCQSQGASCGTRFGPCGRNVDCGTCPSGSICQSIACCRDLGSSCGNSAGGAACCSGICGPRDSAGNYICRRVGCTTTGSCVNSSDCCQGSCQRVDGFLRCSQV